MLFRSKNIDHRTDLYSLGVTMFEMITGRLPFPDGEAGYHHVHTQPPEPTQIVADIPDVLNKVILKLMEKKVKDRYQTAREVLNVLKDISDELTMMNPYAYGMQKDTGLGLMDVKKPDGNEEDESEE